MHQPSMPTPVGSSSFPRHSKWDDLYGLYIGIVFAAMGIALLAKGGLITGGIAGMALIISFLSDYTPAPLIPLINIPFIVFACWAMGKNFGIKSLAVSTALGTAVGIITHMLNTDGVNSSLAALVGGTFLGMGILCLARHKASLGGTGIVTLWLQQRYGINAGKSQLALDIMLFAVAVFFIPADKMLWSLFGTLAMNAMLIVWHKPGRYQG